MTNPRITQGTCAGTSEIKYRMTPVQFESSAGNISLQLHSNKTRQRIAGILTQDGLKQFIAELQEYVEDGEEQTPLSDGVIFLETYSTKAQRLTETLERIETWAERLDTCAEWNGSPIIPIIAEMRQWVKTYGTGS